MPPNVCHRIRRLYLLIYFAHHISLKLCIAPDLIQSELYDSSECLAARQMNVLSWGWICVAGMDVIAAYDSEESRTLNERVLPEWLLVKFTRNWKG